MNKLGWLQLMILGGYSIYVTAVAAAEGLFRWVNPYSSIPYILALGLLCCVYATWCARSGLVKLMFFLLLVAYGVGLGNLRFGGVSDANMRWILEFTGFITVALVFGAASVANRDRSIVDKF